MNRSLFCLMLTLGACTTSPTRRELRDGVPVQRAPVFVAPGYTPTGAGLPEYMPSAEMTPRVARGTDRRTLPATQGPGVWASDETRAGPASSKIGGVLFPPVEVPDADVNHACVNRVDELLTTTGKRSKFDKLKLSQRCMAATLYAQCIEGGAEENARIETENRMRYKLPPLERPKSKAQLDAARIVGALCSPGVLSDPDVYDVMTAVKSALAVGIRSHR